MVYNNDYYCIKGLNCSVSAIIDFNIFYNRSVDT